MISTRTSVTLIGDHAIQVAVNYPGCPTTTISILCVDGKSTSFHKVDGVNSVWYMHVGNNEFPLFCWAEDEVMRLATRLLGGCDRVTIKERVSDATYTLEQINEAFAKAVYPFGSDEDFMQLNENILKNLEWYAGVKVRLAGGGQ